MINICSLHFQLVANVLLPSLDIDDFIIFENMGAYSIAIATRFSGFPLPKVEYYVEFKHWYVFKQVILVDQSSRVL